MVALDFSQTAVIAASGTTSGELIAPVDMTLVAIITPSSLTGTAFSFTASNTGGGTFVAVTDGSGNTITKTMAASKYIGLDPIGDRTIGLKNFKIVSGSTEAASRTFILVYAKL